MLRLHFRHDEEATPGASPAGKALVHRKQFLPLGGVKTLFIHGDDSSLFASHWDSDDDADATPGYDRFELDLNDGTVQVYKMTGDQLLALKNAWQFGKIGGPPMPAGSVDFDIPVDFYGGGKVGLPWGVPFTFRTYLTSDAGTSKNQRIGWELHKPNPADPGTLGLKYMPRYVKTNANLVSGASERPYEITTGRNLVAGFCLPMRSASQGISRIQLITPTDGRILELKREEIFTSQRKYWDVTKYREDSGELFFRFPEPWILDAGSKLLIDGGTDLTASDEIVPLEMVALQSSGSVDMSAVAQAS